MNRHHEALMNNPVCFKAHAFVVIWAAAAGCPAHLVAWRSAGGTQWDTAALCPQTLTERDYLSCQHHWEPLGFTDGPQRWFCESRWRSHWFHLWVVSTNINLPLVMRCHQCWVKRWHPNREKQTNSYTKGKIMIFYTNTCCPPLSHPVRETINKRKCAECEQLALSSIKRMEAA